MDRGYDLHSPKTEFVYLAVVLDAFSRKVVGWSLDRALQSRLPLHALEKAIVNRQPPPGSFTIPIRACNTLAKTISGCFGITNDSEHESAGESV